MPGQVMLLTQTDAKYEDLVPGLRLARVITAAATTQLGGGYMRFDADAEFADWTLSYDEVLFVQEGTLEVDGADGRVTAHPGEAILIPSGAKVTYRGKKGTLGFFALWPFDWNRR
jgi:ethanolamine utilization protein EutQ (cupin superfamily)